MDDVDDAEGGDDADNLEDNIVVSGDASAAAAAKDKVKNSVDAEKSKKVANENRTTTPYMTKYEKARVLGTRALQIRYGRLLAMLHMPNKADSCAVAMLPF
jgi:DNA-directed RNA polymerase I, II, and III subunit RPABC2